MFILEILAVLVVITAVYNVARVHRVRKHHVGYVKSLIDDMPTVPDDLPKNVSERIGISKLINVESVEIEVLVNNDLQHFFMPIRKDEDILGGYMVTVNTEDAVLGLYACPDSLKTVLGMLPKGSVSSIS